MRILPNDILYPITIILLIAVIIYLSNTKGEEDTDMTDNDLKIRIHEEYCKTLNQLYKDKNADYGDSFSKVREEVPNAIVIRIADKYHRLSTLLSKKDIKVKDESIDDTLLDLANYCLLELVERRIDEDKVVMYE